jgi:hypothetical protein
MRSRLLATALCVSLLSLSGCGGPATAPPPEAAVVGSGAKALVEQFVQNARANPAAAAGELSVLMESLDSYAAQQAGPFVELRDTARELQGLLAKPASKPEIDAQLDKLLAKAQALPA